MISRNIFTDILMAFILIAFQIFVLNKMSIQGQYIPVLYPVLIMFYPFYRNNYTYLVIAFLLGLGIDSLLRTWGINAFATTAIAYFRTRLFRSSISNEADSFSFQSIQWTQFLFFIFINIFVHQLLVQYIEFFKLSRVLEVFINVLITSGISFIAILLYALVFRIKEKV
ncbi:rod shape-determining protein MreD [Elizabethkingia sp. JS20170427COW]|uniref:rod shape-determining protein MreD n=1 Tax=Elizabethkingia sp. JS20170427COW TaxID=2583851 RepID=UPI001110F606|nr:rod shape-determining protein MreD [Elizabethkingia sp. JS20170427COW]QCX53050.1 rod shape-determining protein MreD [Elizabethkingia sp. JS20170427COW]